MGLLAVWATVLCHSSEITTPYKREMVVNELPTAIRWQFLQVYLPTFLQSVLVLSRFQFAQINSGVAILLDWNLEGQLSS